MLSRIFKFTVKYLSHYSIFKKGTCLKFDLSGVKWVQKRISKGNTEMLTVDM